MSAVLSGAVLLPTDKIQARHRDRHASSLLLEPMTA